MVLNYSMTLKYSSPLVIQHRYSKTYSQLIIDCAIKMVIVHSYVSLPEASCALAEILKNSSSAQQFRRAPCLLQLSEIGDQIGSGDHDARDLKSLKSHVCVFGRYVGRSLAAILCGVNIRMPYHLRSPSAGAKKESEKSRHI